MLPKFTIHEHAEEGRPTRYSAETTWMADASALGPGVTETLGVDASGKLTTTFPTWGTRKRAERAIEKCKARLR